MFGQGDAESMVQSEKLDEISADIWVQTRCLRIEVLDRDKKPIPKAEGVSCASGFVVDGAWDNAFGRYNPETGLCHLYTCWHVVAGHDPRNENTPAKYTQPFFLKVSGVKSPDANTIAAGQDTLVVPLYNEADKPLWEQEKEHKANSDFKSLNLYLPKSLDAVRIRVDLSENQRRAWAITPRNMEAWRLSLGQDVFVCGFPHGFSALRDIPVPVFFKRSIAATFFDPYQVSLIDGDCAPVMSGGPVFVRKGAEWKLVAMYFGSYFTNMTRGNGPEIKRSALGGIVPLTMVQQSFGSLQK